MNAILSPLVPEFETQEQATSYAAWVKAKVQASMGDPRPGIPHGQVMAEMEAIMVEATSAPQRPEMTLPITWRLCVICIATSAQAVAPDCAQ